MLQSTRPSRSHRSSRWWLLVGLSPGASAGGRDNALPCQVSRSGAPFALRRSEMEPNVDPEFHYVSHDSLCRILCSKLQCQWRGQTSALAPRGASPRRLPPESAQRRRGETKLLAASAWGSGLAQELHPSCSERSLVASSSTALSKSREEAARPDVRENVRPSARISLGSVTRTFDPVGDVVNKLSQFDRIWPLHMIEEAVQEPPDTVTSKATSQKSAKQLDPNHGENAVRGTWCRQRRWWPAGTTARIRTSDKNFPDPSRPPQSGTEATIWSLS